MIGVSTRFACLKRLAVGVILSLSVSGGVQAAPVVSSFRINNDAATTANPAVTLPNVCADAVSATHFYMASESPTFTGATWEPYASVPLFILSSGSGVKTVYFKVKDQTNAESDVTSDTITLEGSGFSVEAWGYFPSQAVLPSPNSGFIAVSEGTSHYLGLRSNGSIVAWGSTTSPIPNNGFVAVAAGDLHSLGLKSDGSIVAWGNDTYGQCSVPSPNQNFVAVAAGVCFSLGLKSDGSIVAWGKNVAGQCNVPSPNQGFVAISAGETHSLGLKSDGSVVAWGNNFYEQCTLPTPNSDFVTISTGNRHNLGLKANGSVVAWGDRTYGQLSIPAPNNSFVAIEGKSLNSVGLKTDGSIVVWGNNDHGQCIVPSPNSGFVALGGGGGGGGGRHILALRVEGILKVTLTPRQAVSAGAQWRLVNETPGLWHDSGTSQSLYPRNNYWIEYKMIRGWQEPMSQIISIEKDQRLSLTGLYQNIPTCSLTTNVTHGYLVTSPKRPDYPVGTTVTLCVRARQGYRFSGWTGDVQPGLEMTNPLTLTMDTTKTLNATFEPVPRGSVQAWGRNSDGQCSIRSPNNDYIALAAGRSHSLGLKCDGSIVAWGRNTEGQCTIPTPNSDFVAIAAGDLHSLGLKSDGSIVAWGSNLYGQCNVPVPNSGFVDLAGGETHSLGLKSDGTIVAWGRNDSGQCSTPSPNGNFVALAAGRAHNLGLHSDGSIVAWGNNTSDQCTIPPPNTGFVSVAAGYSHSLGLKSDGSILIWGSNPYGEGTVPSPNSNFTDVSTGVYSHCLGLKSDGSIMAWGDNTYGQRNVPGPNIGFLDLAVGKYHSLALVPCYDLLTQSTHGNISRVPDQTSYARGTMVTLTAQPDDGCWFDCWTGDVPYGLGRRNPVAITMDTHKTIRMDAGTGPLPPPPVITTFSINNGAPTTVNPAVTLPNICSGVTTSSAVYYMASELSDFTDTTWQLYASIPLFTLSEGNGLKTVYFIVKNSAGVESAVTSDTITLSGPGFPIVGWGINSYGAYTVPSPNNDFVAIEAGYYHTLGLKTDGSIAAWGYNGSGQCTIPSSNNSFVAIAVGGEHSLGLKSNGSIVAWGYNGSTQCTIPAPNNGFVTVAAGYSHSLGLKSDGSVVAWGSNWAGQCTVPSPNSGFVAVSAGWAHSVGLKADGSIVTWGFNATVPTLNSGFVAISAGYEHNLGLKSDSSIVAWGRNTQGECNVPQPNTGYVSIEAGSTHNLALKLDGSIVAWGRTIGGPCTIPVPNSGFVAISAGDSFSLAMASEKMGSLKVALTPADAVITGAQWRLTSETQGVWHNSGDTVRVRGEQRLTFKEIHGWNKPEDQSVNVTTESAVSKTANYTPVTWTLSTLCSSDTLQTVPSGAHFFHGTTVTLTALPQADCWFDHWTGDVPERLKRVNPLILTMDDNKTIGVDFDSGVPPSAPVIWNFSINNGAATTANPVVTLSNTCTDVTSASATHYLASESSDFTSSTWQSYATVPLFTLSSGSGVKTVYLKVRNSALVESSVTSDTITLIGPNLSIAAWGANRNFQCGTPSPNNNFLALAAGGQHSMGLKSDSSIVAWGDRVYGQCRVPLPNRDFVALAAGYRHSLGLKSDGSIRGWGWNDYGQCTVPLPNRNFVAVAAGETHSLGLKSDGSIVAWGKNDFGQCNIPSPNSGFVAIAAGNRHSLGLKSDGSIIAWGSNTGLYEQYAGQCDVPTPNTGFQAIAVGYYHSLGLKSDGSMRAWGSNLNTYLEYTGQCDIPLPNSDFLSFSGGNSFSIGLKSDGTIRAWGSNTSGACRVPPLNSDVVEIAAGGDHVLALLADKGRLQVTLTPSEAVISGARWRLTGEDVWRETGTSLTLPTGAYVVEYDDDLPGWDAELTTETVMIEQNKLTSITHSYLPEQTWSLFVSGENGTVNQSPHRTYYRSGTTVTLTATPDPNFHFTGWSGELTTTTNPVVLTMDSTKTITAHFAINEYILMVETRGTEGTVSISPAKAAYPYGSTITLSAIPAWGQRFVRWEGNIPPGNETTPSLTLTMTNNRTVRAVFEQTVSMWIISKAEKSGGRKR